MLQDRILKRDEFSQLLQIRAGTITQRIYTGEIVFAFGCRINAHIGEYLVPDAIAVLMTSMLSTEIGMKAAAELVRETWDGTHGWLRAVQEAEGDPRLYTQTPIPTEDHLFLTLGIEKGRLPKAVVGLMSDCLRDLSGYGIIRGISIQLVLRQLRVNGRQYKVALPDRLTPPLDHPDLAQWRREIGAYQKLATMRFKAKLKAKKAGARAKEIA